MSAPVKTDVPPRRRPKRRRGAVNPRFTPYLFVGAALLFELLVHLVPMASGVITSFFSLNQYFIRQWFHAPFAGLDNYRVALDFDTSVGSALLHSFLVTIAYALVVVASSWALGFAGAVTLQRSFRGRGWLRTVFLIPYAMPVFAGVIVWSFMFQREGGLVNKLLVDTLHLFEEQQFWLLGDKAFFAAATVAIWRTWPFAFLSITAGLQSIGDDVYEAASIDGANSWKQIRHITLGLLRPVNAVLILMMFLWSFNDFNTAFVLFGETPPKSMDVITIHVYSTSFHTWEFGLGSAMSVLALLFLLVVTGGWLAWNRRGERNEK
ncbi:MAG: sugar ABC transporter permease [Bifidobacteriaceae bacterium]|jgi:multiple sugar transport system permease protein|nr:sugar ABC transporter permease [Bifidobacteriaceae bacterium]